MGEGKVVVRVDQEVWDCFECPYCVQPTDVLAINGHCSRGDFKIDDAFRVFQKNARSGWRIRNEFRSGPNLH